MSAWSLANNNAFVTSGINPSVGANSASVGVVTFVTLNTLNVFDSKYKSLTLANVLVEVTSANLSVSVFWVPETPVGPAEKASAFCNDNVPVVDNIA